MLGLALIFALTAHTALAKPTGNCIFMCEAKLPGGSGWGSGSSGAYTQPGFGYVGSGYGQVGSGFNQVGAGFGQASGAMMRPPGYFPNGPTHGAIEEFEIAPVQPSYAQPAHTEVVQHRIPVQPEINAMFTHSSSKSSYEANHGVFSYHQPGVSQTVVSEPMTKQPLMRLPAIRQPSIRCQEFYDPCH